VLGGCLAALPHVALGPPSGHEMRPEAFFQGRTRGTGTLAVRGKTPAIVRVTGTGRTEPGGAFRLDQTIVHETGTPDRRSWTMHRDGATGYRATLTDAAGPVTGEVDGPVFRLRYKYSTWGLTMHQTLTLLPGDTVVQNEATVRFLGVPVARLSERIVRLDGPM